MSTSELDVSMQRAVAQRPWPLGAHSLEAEIGT